MKWIFTILISFPCICWGQSHAISDIIPMEYWSAYQTSDNNLYALEGGALTNLTSSIPGGRLAKKGGGCFNLVRLVCTDGTLWQSSQYNVGLTWTQIPTDSSGASITNAIWINGYADNYVLIRADSSLWFGGVDDPGIFHSSGSIFMRPFQMTTTLVKFRKAIICSRGVYAISSDSLSLYYWGFGAGQTPTTIYTFTGSGTGKIIDIAASNGNAFTSATFAVIQQTAGSAYGHPYALGQGYGFWASGTSQNFTTFTDLYSQWGLSSLVKEITVNFQTTVFIDSIGGMYSCGWNVQGEVGNGVEFVNRYTYPNWPNYGWDGAAGENVVVGLQKIGGSVHWEHVYTNLFFTYYHVATDINDSLYSWGRNKTQVQLFGLVLNPTDNAAQPNAMDILSPTMCSPFAIISTKILNWTGPTIGITATANVHNWGDTLTLTGHPALLINASLSTDTVNYTNVSNVCQQISGPTNNNSTISNLTSKQFNIKGLFGNGTYVYGINTTDNNTGMNFSSVTLTVPVGLYLRKRGVALTLVHH